MLLHRERCDAGQSVMEARSKRIFWYTRRDGVVRGPYPQKQISRYILLGRIRESDELRAGEGEWKRVSDHPALIPEVMKLPPTEENRQKLLIARMREDERRPGDRRGPVAGLSPVERRGRAERRRAEAPELLRHRELKYRVSHSRAGNDRLYRYPLGFSALVLLGFLVSYLGQQRLPQAPASDCAAPPGPGVNWNNCNLSGLRGDSADLLGAQVRNARLDAAQLSNARLVGADLEFTSLNLCDLRAADLSQANLRGVNLRGSDLRYATLAQANLAYANLSEARLEGADLRGAILDHSIWINQQTCAPGSVGQCRPLQGPETDAAD
jgi:hypothetical protein